jgi:hypothetical protein
MMLAGSTSTLHHLVHQEGKNVVEIVGFGNGVIVFPVGEFFPCPLFGFAEGVEIGHVFGTRCMD